MNEHLSQEEMEKLTDLLRIYGKKELASFFNVQSIEASSFTESSSPKIRNGIRRYWKSHMRSMQK